MNINVLSARPAGRALLLVLLAPLLAGCASGGGSEEPGDVDPALASGIGVQVENRMNPPVSLTVFLRGPPGSRTLGSVSPNRTRTFDIELEALGSDEYYLVAQGSGGAEITSTPFRLSPGVTVNWRLPANGITVGY